LIAAFIVVQVLAGVLLFGTKSSLAWFGSGSCPMPGGFVAGQKCLAVDANGVEVPWKGEIILPKGTTSITDHALFNGSTPIAGNYQLQLVEDNGSCCTVYQTIDYVVAADGSTTPASFPLNAAALTEAYTHHAVGTGGLLGYFLFISNHTPIPAGATCQNTVTFNGATGSLGSGTSASGEKCNNPTPVPGSGALAGHIIDCTSGVAAAGDITPAGAISVTGPVSKAAAANPVAYPLVPVGQYTETATAPAGYHFIYDCPHPLGASQGSPTSATATVDVPLQGSGAGYFYVARETGVIVGHVIDCTGGTPAPADIVPAGTLGITAGPVTEVAKANPAQWSVPTGTYTMAATAPANFHLVDCAGITKSPTQQVVVPNGGQGTATFYVAHDTGSLAAHILDCTGNVVGTTDIVPAGKVSAAGPTTIAQQANPMSATVLSGDYTVTGVAPAGFHLVACNNQTESSTRTVHVPANGSAEAVFYVTHDRGSLAGTIIDCASGKAATGSLAATGPTNVPVLTSTASTVMTGTYVVTATLPSGNTVVDKDCKPAGSTQTVTVPANHTTNVVFYSKTPAPVVPPGGGTQGTGGTPGSTNPPSTNPVQAVIAAVTGQAPAQGVKGAATTQPNTGRAELLRDALLSLVLLVVGATIVVVSRRKATA
jgi:hypothetical protein